MKADLSAARGPFYRCAECNDVLKVIMTRATDDKCFRLRRCANKSCSYEYISQEVYIEPDDAPPGLHNLGRKRKQK